MESKYTTSTVKLTDEEYQKHKEAWEKQKHWSTTKHFDPNKPFMSKEKLEEVLTLSKQIYEEEDMAKRQ